MQPWLSFEAPMSSVSALGLPCFSKRRVRAGIGRIEPRAGGEAHDAAADAVADACGGEAGAAIVEHAQQVAVGDAARAASSGWIVIGWRPFTLVALRVRAVVELAVQLVGRLVRQHVQRIALGGLRAQPLDRLQPHGVARAIVVAERVRSSRRRSRSCPTASSARFFSGSARKSASITGSRCAPLASAMPASQNSSNGGIVHAGLRRLLARLP